MEVTDFTLGLLFNASRQPVGVALPVGGFGADADLLMRSERADLDSRGITLHAGGREILLRGVAAAVREALVRGLPFVVIDSAKGADREIRLDVVEVPRLLGQAPKGISVGAPLELPLR